MPRERMLELIAQVGAEQLIFGLDFPYNLESNTRIALDTLFNLGLTQEQLAQILGGNLRQALGLPEHPPKGGERHGPTYGAPD
jgi:predicted TIM-barrel fold metal-dependent hydrolase